MSSQIFYPLRAWSAPPDEGEPTYKLGGPGAGKKSSDFISTNQDRVDEFIPTTQARTANAPILPAPAFVPSAEPYNPTLPTFYRTSAPVYMPFSNAPIPTAQGYHQYFPSE